jgi:methyl coenzyme M reductase subunit C
MQALAQWRHPVASSEDREVLQWAMRPTSHHHIRVVNEITSNLPALLQYVIIDYVVAHKRT